MWSSANASAFDGARPYVALARRPSDAASVASAASAASCGDLDAVVTSDIGERAQRPAVLFVGSTFWSGIFSLKFGRAFRRGSLFSFSLFLFREMRSERRHTGHTTFC
jgi:hypothetical protein